MWFNSSWLVASMANDLPEVAYQAMRFCMVIEEPEDYCDTFEGRGQQEQDWHNLANGQGD